MCTLKNFALPSAVMQGRQKNDLGVLALHRFLSLKSSSSLFVTQSIVKQKGITNHELTTIAGKILEKLLPFTYYFAIPVLFY